LSEFSINQQQEAERIKIRAGLDPDDFNDKDV
jgi:hypothetical protein